MVMNRIHTPGILKTSTELVSCHDWAAWAVRAMQHQMQLVCLLHLETAAIRIGR